MEVTVLVPADVERYGEMITGQQDFERAAEMPFVKKKVVVPYSEDLVHSTAEAAAREMPCLVGPTVLDLKVERGTAYVLLDIDCDGWAGVSFCRACCHPVIARTLLQFTNRIERVVWQEPPANFAARDLTNYRIQTVEIPMPSEIKELYGWMHEFHLFRNVLRFRWSELDIDIARSASMRPSVGRGLEEAGFDPESLRIRWLDPGRLIWMKWGTFPQGQGRYSQQGHLVLWLDGESLNELFRDSIYAYGSGGMLSSTKVDLDIRYDPPIRELSFVRTTVQRGSSDKKRLFMEDELTTDQGNTIYFGEGRTQTLWRYRIENGQLRFISGERSAELPKECSVLEVSEAFRVPVAELRRVNPKMQTADRASGTLVLEDRVGPYAHENHDGICGDKPCPKE